MLNPGRAPRGVLWPKAPPGAGRLGASSAPVTGRVGAEHQAFRP